jgi:hypothetical protein
MALPKDGSVLAFAPPLPARSSTAFTQSAAVRDRHVGNAAAATSAPAHAEEARAGKVQEATNLLVATSLDEVGRSSAHPFALNVFPQGLHLTVLTGSWSGPCDGCPRRLLRYRGAPRSD